MNVKKQTVNDDGLVVEVSGRLDLRVAPELQAALREALEGSTGRMVVDLAHVEFIDSAALGILVGIHRDAEERSSKVALVEPEGPAKQIFALTKTDHFFNLFASLEEAMVVA